MDIYLSPHCDDVCFSIGVLASRQGGHLINVFTASSYVAREMELPSDPTARVGLVSGLRRAEDEAFAQAAGLERHDLGLAEAPVRGFDPFDLRDLMASIDEVSERMVPWLRDLVVREGGGAGGIYCPMGIGGHRDHLTVLGIVRRVRKVLARHRRLFLYEDLPYASRRGARRRGLEAATRLFEGVELRPTVIALDGSEIERKMAWIGLYASQHPATPRAEDFTPASGIEAGPHEIVWEVRPADPVQSGR